jgi:signal transduction histidine kinase/ligand-binding sensor domain-containing protein
METIFRHKRTALLLVCSLLFSRTLFPQYILDQWTTANGLPQSTVNAVAQDRQGYVLLGTSGGLVKFDGLRFTNIEALANKMLSNRILSLLSDGSRTLWIGTEGGGLTRFRNDSVRNFTSADGLDDGVITALCADRSGKVWIGTRNGIQSLFGDKILTEPLPARQSSRVFSLFQDSQGILWANIGGDVYRKAENGSFEKVVFPAQKKSGHSFFLCEDREKRLWFRDGENIGAAADHSVSQTKWSVSFQIMREYERAIQDSSGNFWIASLGGGLYDGGKDFSKRQFDSYVLPGGKGKFHVLCAFIDREGNRWFGTDGDGLIRIKEKKFELISTGDGLLNEMIKPVMEDSKGNIWIGMNCSGLNKISATGSISSVPMHLKSPNSCVWSLAEDREGNIWAGTSGDGLYCFNGRNFVILNDRNGLSSNTVFALQSDQAGNVWIGTNGGGLNVYRGGILKVYRQKDGLVNDSIRTIYEDRDHSLWIGTLDGLSHFENGKFTNYTAANGLTNNSVRSIYRDSDGILWIGTNGGGLISCRNGIFKPVTTANGLFDNVVSTIIDDGNGSFWMTCKRGVYSVNRALLKEYIDGRVSEICCTAYGVEEGLADSEINGGFQPAAWKTRDNLILFPTAKGLAVLPLEKVTPANASIPPVCIERIIVDQHEYAPGTKIEIPYGSRHIEIQYTALNLSNPQHVFFKFKLEGLQKDWVVAGSRRSAFYSDLPSGDYRFQVLAAKGGLWNQFGAAVDLTILTPWWGSWLFRCSALLIVGLLGFFFYNERKRIWIWMWMHLHRDSGHLENSRRLLDSVEKERKRIAGELHDSIGQDLLIIKNRALLALQEPKKKNMLEQLEQISTSVSHAIDQTREISYNLRPYQIDQLGLKKALESITGRLARVSSTRFEVQIDELDEIVPKERQIHLYRIVQECVSNVVKHADAKECRVSVQFKAPHIIIEISDNGKGFVYAAERSKKPQQRGIGLQSTAERIRVLGGTFKLHSIPGKGTTIRIEIPL